MIKINVIINNISWHNYIKSPNNYIDRKIKKLNLREKKSFKKSIFCTLLLSGNKEEQKEYFKHTNYPGGAKTSSVKLLREKNPAFILKNSIKGMLPHNRLGKKILEHLKIYVGEDHPHAARKPLKLEL